MANTILESKDDSFIKLSKLDLFLSAIIGFVVAISIWIIGENINFENTFFIWLFFLFPVLSASGLWLTYSIGKRWSTAYQLGKYFLVGSLNTFVDLGVLNLLILLGDTSTGTAYSIFKGVAFVVAVVNSYFWNKLWTFQSGKGNFIQFLLISIAGFVINVGVASLVVNVIGPLGGVSAELWANIGAVIATFISLIWNFIGYKFFVFKE